MERYRRDSLLDAFGAEKAVVGGAGMGGTIALRTALGHIDRCAALVVISLEDIEDDVAKAAEIRFMDAFAERVRKAGIEAAWAPVLPDLAPVIGSMVREAIPRSDPQSVAAAAAIGHDRSFRSVEEMALVDVPTLIFAGMDRRHPRALAEAVVDVMPQGELAPNQMTDGIEDAVDFGEAFAPAVSAFVARLKTGAAIWQERSRKDPRLVKNMAEAPRVVGQEHVHRPIAQTPRGETTT